MTKQSYINQQWLESNPLVLETVMSYFSLSPFYDRSSLNEILKMQTQFANFLDFSKKLTDLDGMKYIVDQKHDIFYIYKINKYRSNEKLLDFYYIFYGVIYKGTTIDEIFETRMFNFLFYINESITRYLQRRKFNVISGFFSKNEGKANILDKQKSTQEKEIMQHIIRDIYSSK